MTTIERPNFAYGLSNSYFFLAKNIKALSLAMGILLAINSLAWGQTSFSREIEHMAGESLSSIQECQNGDLIMGFSDGLQGTGVRRTNAEGVELWSRLHRIQGLTRELSNGDIAVIGLPRGTSIGMEALKLNSQGQALIHQSFPLNGIRAAEATQQGGIAVILADKRVVELDSNLNVVWQRQYNLGGTDFLFQDLFPTADGGYLMCGTTKDGPFQEEDGGFIMRSDSSGTPLWCRRFSETIYTNFLQQVIELPNGNAVAAGRWGSQFSFGSIPYLFLSLDSSGALEETNLQYQPFGSGAGMDFPDMALLENGNFAVAGNYGSGFPSVNGTDLIWVFNSDLKNIGEYRQEINAFQYNSSNSNSITGTSDKGIVATGLQFNFSQGDSIGYLMKILPDSSACFDGFKCPTQVSNYIPPNFLASMGSSLFTANPTPLLAWDSLVSLSDTLVCRDSLPIPFSHTGNLPLSYFAFSSNGSLVNFTDQSSHAASWFWDFGDGNTATQQNPQHNYAALGTYTVCLTIANACGTDSSCQSVTITCQAPSAAFAASSNQLTASFTDQSTTATTLTGWFWDFGDGSTATQQNPQHTYAAQGTYTACLTVTDSCGSDSSCQTVTIACPAPTAAFSSSGNGTTLTFTDQSSSANTISAWLWDFGDGSNSTLSNPQHTYGALGSYTVCLTITDSCGQDSICQATQVMVAIDQEEFAKLLVYPIPASNLVSIEMQPVSYSPAVIRLFSLHGKLLKETIHEFKSQGKKTIDLSSFSEGSYLIEIQSGNSVTVRKVQVIR